ncbi:MAG: hypothetical protein K0R05_4802 [Anaerocolumna sp.]|jgi:hypothetical protein|nr:hypothetical protein [Anaerocolumna sp.]
MRQLYLEVERIIKSIDFNILWKGFHPYPFAIYNTETIWLEKEEIPYQPEFCANTCIRFRGELLAIWQITESEEWELVNIAVGVVHEMFHCYQEELGESRYPDDLKILSYPMEERNFRVKLKENRLLAASMRTQDINTRKKLLTYFKACRQFREELIGDDIHQEYRVETIEGAAEYISLLALKEMGEEMIYVQRLEEYMTVLEEGSARQLDIRRISYVTGAVLLLLLSQVRVHLTPGIGQTVDTFWELAAKECSKITREVYKDTNDNDLMKVLGEPCSQQEFIDYQQKGTNAEDLKELKDIMKVLGEPCSQQEFIDYQQKGTNAEDLKELKDIYSCDIGYVIEEYKEKQKEQIKLFFQENRKKYIIEGFISGYDPMNMIKLERFILCSHFIVITETDSKNQLVLNGPVVVQLKESKGREINGYFK